MKPIRILIVEDEFIIASNLKLVLEDLGYEPLTPAGNKKEALEILKQEEVDLAILDINLDGKNEGIEIGQFIQDQIHIPFIYLTSNADKATILDAKKTKPRSYLIKPFNEHDIYSSIEMAMADRDEQTAATDEDEKLNILSDCLFVKLGSKFYKVEIKDITHIEADGKMMNLFTLQGQKFSIRSSLEGLFHQLKPFHFVRIHRGYCINTLHLEVINSDFVQVNKQEIPLGRSYRDDLLNRIRTIS